MSILNGWFGRLALKAGMQRAKDLAMAKKPEKPAKEPYADHPANKPQPHPGTQTREPDPVVTQTEPEPAVTVSGLPCSPCHHGCTAASGCRLGRDPLP